MDGSNGPMGRVRGCHHKAPITKDVRFQLGSARDTEYRLSMEVILFLKKAQSTTSEPAPARCLESTPLRSFGASVQREIRSNSMDHGACFGVTGSVEQAHGHFRSMGRVKKPAPKIA